MVNFDEIDEKKEKISGVPNLCIREALNSGYLIKPDVLNQQYFEILNNQSPIQIPGGTRLMTNNQSPVIFKLENEQTNELLAIIRLISVSSCGQEFYKVDKVKSFEEGKGYARFLYEYSISSLDKPIISDRIQTMPGSSNLWKSLKNNSDGKGYEIQILNENTGRQVKYEKPFIITDYEIWGWDPDFIPFMRMNSDFLKDALSDGDLNKTVYKYLSSNLKKVKDRSHIKLIGIRN